MIRTRQAGDLLGATKMDRPEWIAIDQDARTVYCTLTNNNRRGRRDHPDVDAANPRASNTMGHIIQWTEDGDFDSTTFRWKHLVLAGDPATGEVRRFLTGPVGCEITGIALTPDGRTMFVNIQHPGEPLTPRHDGLEVPNLHSNPADPRRYSNWPDFRPDGRPRSATVAIRRADGGSIGT